MSKVLDSSSSTGMWHPWHVMLGAWGQASHSLKVVKIGSPPGHRSGSMRSASAGSSAGWAISWQPAQNEDCRNWGWKEPPMNGLMVSG
jgi:hypothetical protein